MDKRSDDDINNEEPNPLNNIIKQYSVRGVYNPIKLYCFPLPSPMGLVLGVDDEPSFNKDTNDKTLLI